MFAPQPIIIRYGDDGLLGQAAAAAGMGIANQRAYEDKQQAISRDLSFINADLNRQAQFQQMTAENALQDRRLQMAGDLALQRGSTATAASAGNIYSPLTQAVRNAKNTILANVGGGLPEDQQATLQSLANSPDVNAEQFNATASKMVQAQKSAQSKQGILDAAKKQIDPEDADLIAGLAADDKYSANELRIAIQNSAKKKQAKTAAEPQQREKITLWSKAMNLLSSDDQQVLGSLVNDPKVTTSQLATAINQARLRAAQGQHASANQQMIQQRFERSLAQQNLRGIEKQYPGIGEANPNDLDPETKKVYDQYQALKQQAAGMQQFAIGQVISTPKGPVKVVGFDQADGHPLVEPVTP
jgi:hypothetical protein